MRVRTELYVSTHDRLKAPGRAWHQQLLVTARERCTLAAGGPAAVQLLGRDMVQYNCHCITTRLGAAAELKRSSNYNRKSGGHSTNDGEKM